MFIGHFVPAFVAATLPKAPRLGILFIAAQFVDILFFPFVMLGIEHMRIIPGFTATNPMDLYHMPFTHSLIGGAAWAAVFAAVFWSITKSRTGALIGAAVVLSHWLLDVLVHTQDMTLFGGDAKFGLGLWNYPIIEMPLELAITGAALGFYLGRTRAVNGATLRPAWLLGCVLLLAQLYNWFAPPPATFDIGLPLSALAGYALCAWLAFRLDRTRALKGAGEI